MPLVLQHVLGGALGSVSWSSAFTDICGSDIPSGEYCQMSHQDHL